jgi:hypothetical protein
MQNRTDVRPIPGLFGDIHPPPMIAATVLFLWLAYIGLEALIFTGRVLPPLNVALAFLPGLLGLAVILSAGFTARECYLQIAPLSRKGMLALLLTLPLLLPVYLAGYLSGTWAGWNAANLLLYGPAGAITQVLFFRCVLLPVLLRMRKGHPTQAIILAALMHGLWHVGPLVQGYAWYQALPVMLVPFLVGIAWNWQVQHDRTILWVMILHILTDQGIVLFYGTS